MKKTIGLLILAILFISLAACAEGVDSNHMEPTSHADEPVVDLPGQSSNFNTDDVKSTPDPDGQVVGSTDQGGDPTPDFVDQYGNDLLRGNVYINSAELRILESFPIQVMLNIKGDLPTPCDIFGYTISPPNDENQIHIEVFSLGVEGEICIQVLEPFAENISVSNLDTPLEDGSYTVWVNGELVSEFDYQGG